MVMIFQITKLNVKQLSESDCVQHYPTSTVTDLLINSESFSPSRRRKERKDSIVQKLNCDLSSPGSPCDSAGNLIDPKSLYYASIYEVEVWLKYNNGSKGTVRKKLDLLAKCHPKIGLSSTTSRPTNETGLDETEAVDNVEDVDEEPKYLTSSQERLFEADRDYVAHETIVQDMWSYLKRKGIKSPEDFLSLPIRYIIVIDLPPVLFLFIKASI